MGDILCDEPTHSHARYKANYEELEPFMVKGKKQPVGADSQPPARVAKRPVMARNGTSIRKHYAGVSSLQQQLK
jgi:hypothetical protein